MNLFKIFISILVLILFVNVASAVRYVNYEFKEAVILSNGQLSLTNNLVNDVNVLGVICLNDVCSNAVGSLWDNQILNSGSQASIQLTYPTSLLSAFGYGIYYFKEGYIPWEQNPDWWGTASSDPQGPFTIYLTKKEICSAPIENLIIENEVQQNIPLVINVGATLSATEHAAIQNAGPLAYVPTQIAEHYSVLTEVIVDIYDSTNNVVNHQVKTVLIPYSGTANVQFSWIPSITGTYRAVAATRVVDAKCISSQQRSTEKNFHVIADNPKNMCYTLLNNLHVSNQFPLENETITISGTKISNHADNNYVLVSVPTNITIYLLNESGSIIYSASQLVASNPNVIDSVPFDFSYEVENAGKYKIILDSIASSSLCTGIPNLPELETIDIEVKEGHDYLNQAPSIENLPDLTFNENDIPGANLIDLWQYASDIETVDNQLQFSIVSQSDLSLINCVITDNRYINCNLAANSYGFSEVSIEVSDSQLSDRDSFRIAINKDSTESPVIGNIPDISFAEDSSAVLNLDLYVNDPDNSLSELSWSVSGNQNVKISIDGAHFAIFTADPEWNGVEIVTFTVSDPEGNVASDKVVVTVGSINDAPILRDIPNIKLGVNEVVKINLNDYVIDLDNQNSELIWSYTINSKNIEVSIDSNNIATIKSKTKLGKNMIIFTVTDLNGATASDSCNVDIDYTQKSSDLAIDTVRIQDEYLEPGNDLVIEVGLKNSGYKDFDRIKISVLIYDLGIDYATTGFDLNKRDNAQETISIPLPEYVPKGIYDVRIVISNDNIRRVINREFVVI